MNMPRTLFADRHEAEVEQRHFRAPPDAEDRMVAKIINLVRRANLTVSPPAHIKPTVWSNPLDLSVRVTVPQAVGAYQTALSFKSPPGRWTRVENYGVEVQDAAYDYSGSILWRFRKNGLPLGEGMSDWGIQRGSIFNPRTTYIILEEDDVLDFQVRRAIDIGVAQDVDMAFTGWTWRTRNNYQGTAGSVTAY